MQNEWKHRTRWQIWDLVLVLLSQMKIDYIFVEGNVWILVKIHYIFWVISFDLLKWVVLMFYIPWRFHLVLLSKIDLNVKCSELYTRTVEDISVLFRPIINRFHFVVYQVSSLIQRMAIISFQIFWIQLLEWNVVKLSHFHMCFLILGNKKILEEFVLSSQ